MSSLTNKIRAYLGRHVDFQNEIQLRNNSDGKGDYIFYWSDDIEKSKPTDEQLNALESQADTLASNNQVIATRINLYGTTAEQFEYIVENGVDAFITKQNQIKTENPKS